jgi:hypothetical protein
MKEMTQLYKTGDLCPIGINVIGGNVPRLKFVNYCGSGQLGTLYDFEVTSDTTTYINDHIESLMNIATVS